MTPSPRWKPGSPDLANSIFHPCVCKSFFASSTFPVLISQRKREKGKRIEIRRTVSIIAFFFQNFSSRRDYIANSRWKTNLPTVRTNFDSTRSRFTFIVDAPTVGKRGRAIVVGSTNPRSSEEIWKKKIIERIKSCFVTNYCTELSEPKLIDQPRSTALPSSPPPTR